MSKIILTYCPISKDMVFQQKSVVNRMFINRCAIRVCCQKTIFSHRVKLRCMFGSGKHIKLLAIAWSAIQNKKNKNANNIYSIFQRLINHQCICLNLQFLFCVSCLPHLASNWLSVFQIEYSSRYCQELGHNSGDDSLGQLRFFIKGFVQATCLLIFMQQNTIESMVLYISKKPLIYLAKDSQFLAFHSYPPITPIVVWILA